MLSRQDLKQLGSDLGRGNPVCMDAKHFTPPCPRWLESRLPGRPGRPQVSGPLEPPPGLAGGLLSREPWDGAQSAEHGGSHVGSSSPGQQPAGAWSGSQASLSRAMRAGTGPRAGRAFDSVGTTELPQSHCVDGGGCGLFSEAAFC